MLESERTVDALCRDICDLQDKVESFADSEEEQYAKYDVSIDRFVDTELNVLDEALYDLHEAERLLESLLGVLQAREDEVDDRTYAGV